MRHCPNCDSAVPAEATHCPFCGAPLAAHAAPPSPAAHQVPVVPPRAPHGPHYTSAYPASAAEGLTTGQYLGFLLLFAIPIIGWFFLFYFSFSKRVLPVHKNLARAVLLKGCMMLVILLVVLVILLSALFPLFQEIFSTEAPSYYPEEMPFPEDFNPFYDEFYDGFSDDFFERFFQEYDTVPQEVNPPRVHFRT